MVDDNVHGGLHLTKSHTFAFCLERDLPEWLQEISGSFEDVSIVGSNPVTFELRVAINQSSQGCPCLKGFSRDAHNLPFQVPEHPLD